MQSPHFGSVPRRVPPSLQIVNFFNGFSLIGWLIFGFGMIFAWAFVLNADFSFVTFRGPFAVAEGRVTDVEETGASVNRRRVHANHYEYSVAGNKFSGTSYTTGDVVSTGDSVSIEYDEDHPARSRITGMRRAMFGPGLVFVMIFPLVGLLILIPATIFGIKRNRLLRDGLLADGTLTSKSATNMQVNNRTVYELIFTFTARDGRQYEAKARSTDTRRLEDESQEPLLYDPADPTRACLLDEAPARPEFEPNGDLRGNPASAIRMLIVPGIVIVGHGTFLLFKLGMFS